MYTRLASEPGGGAIMEAWIIAVLALLQPQLRLKQRNAVARYAPFSVEEVLVGIRHADADVVLAVADLLDLDIPRAQGNHYDLLVSGTVVLVVKAAGGLALRAITVTDAAAVLRGIGVHRPVAADFLKIRGCLILRGSSSSRERDSGVPANSRTLKSPRRGGRIIPEGSSLTLHMPAMHMSLVPTLQGVPSRAASPQGTITLSSVSVQ